MPSIDTQSAVRMIPPNRSAGGIWLVVLVAIGLLVAALIFPFPIDGRLWGAVFDLAHCPAFFLALVGLVALLNPRAAGLSQLHPPTVQMTFTRCVLAAVVLFAVGAASEFLQQFAGRNTSAKDLAANGLGILAGLTWLGGIAFNRRRTGLILTTLIIVIASIRPLTHIAASYRQIKAFPLLASFESSLELGSWRPVHSELTTTNTWQTDGKSSLQVRLSSANYSGAEMHWFEQDWSPYQALEFDIQNPEPTTTTIVLKIADRHHNRSNHAASLRYETAVAVEPGASKSVRIDLKDVASAPRDRKIDLSEIRRLEFFTTKKAEGQYVRIDHVRLTQ